MDGNEHEFEIYLRDEEIKQLKKRIQELEHSQFGLVRNPQSLVDNFWNFQPFTQATGMGFTDIDAITERKGNLLAIETKNLNAPVNRGQDILFERLPNSTVMYLFGRKNKPEQMRILKPNGQLTDLEPCTMDDVIEKMNVWKNWADRNSKL